MIVGKRVGKYDVYAQHNGIVIAHTELGNHVMLTYKEMATVAAMFPVEAPAPDAVHPVPEKSLHGRTLDILDKEMEKVRHFKFDLTGENAEEYQALLDQVRGLAVILYKEASNWAREYRIAIGQEQP